MASVRLLLPLLAVVLAGCNTTGSQSQASLGGARGATVAFESIDGPPREVFDRLVRGLNTEALSQNLAVVSRADPSAYRVRGYLVAGAAGKQSTIDWVWDVYNDRQQRVLRITGAQAVNGKHEDLWRALGDPGVEEIARDSIGQLATFLTSPDAMPSAQVAAGEGESPEAAGIFRIIPASVVSQELAPEQAAEQADVPLPPHRPRLARTASLTNAAAATADE